jgi:lipoprotein-anchoring transpeptidase ErfK/SrfK
MLASSRRQFLTAVSAMGASWALSGCATAPPPPKTFNQAFRRTEVDYATTEKRGTIVVDPTSHFLYHVGDGGRAMRYGVAVGTEGFGWSGIANVHDKQEWPDWYPTAELLDRHPDIVPHLRPLQSGMGMPGGPENPLGARALYLWQGKKDTLYRIHGTNEPWTIGTNVSSGCIRMQNEDAIELYDQVKIGSRVVVMPYGVGSPQSA